jgi:hypothetical protein
MIGLYHIALLCGLLCFLYIGTIEWIGVCFDQSIIKLVYDRKDCILISSIIPQSF